MADPHDHRGIPSDPIKFTEAIAALLDRVPMTKGLFDELDAAEQEFAFTVAGVTEADLVAQVFDEIERAVRDGTTFEDFRSAVGEKLEASWGGEKPGRLETIFRTNVEGAYNAGRYREMTAPAVRRARPYWRYDAIEDATLDDCPICSRCAGVILPADHPWWRTHYPILHPNCRCVATPLTEEEARAEGITRNPPDVRPPAGFGKAPSVTGSDWEPDAEDYPAEIRGELEERISSAG